MKNPLSPARIRESFRELGGAIVGLRSRDLSPERAAGSVAIGLFVGSTPFYGFHFPLCAGLAYLLGLDVIIAYLAANVSVAPLVPLIVFTEVQIGSFLLDGEWLSLSMSDFNLTEALAMTQRLMVGVVVLGSAMAALGGGLTLYLLRRFRRSKNEHKDDLFLAAIARTKAHYADAPAAHRHYVSSKLRFDPLSHELYLFGKAKAPLGHIVDAGCGRGQFAFLLLELGYGTQVWGFDHDAAKVAVAQNATLSLSGGSAHFETGDLKSKSFPAADTFLLLDVLHYLDLQAQDAVLQRSTAALNEGGHLLVRETNHQGGWGPRLASVFEVLARLFGINRGDRLVFRAPGEIEAVLNSYGLMVVRHTPKGALDNVLLVATKARATD